MHPEHPEKFSRIIVEDEESASLTWGKTSMHQELTPHVELVVLYPYRESLDT